MPDYGTASTPGIAKASRLDNDIERIATLTRRISMTTERILQHARVLGYFQNQPETTGKPPIPISRTLQDVLNDLENAVDSNSATLNIFD